MKIKFSTNEEQRKNLTDLCVGIVVLVMLFFFFTRNDPQQPYKQPCDQSLSQI